MTLEPTGHVETTDAGRTVVIVRTFKAPIEDVWASLTEPERVARWFGTMVGEAGPGRTVMVTMSAEQGPGAEPAHILECDPPRSFVADVGSQPVPWRVSVQLAEDDGVTTMTFVHALADDVDATDIGPGWEFYADRLQASRDGGDMPDWDADGYLEALGPHYGGG